MVLVGHCWDFFLSNQPAWQHQYRIQEYGVVIFFVLSGYLIAHSCTKQQSKNSDTPFLDYLRARGVRIYSTLLAALVLIAILDVLFISDFTQDFPTNNSWLTFLVNVLHLQEYPFTHFTYFGTGFPLWSLAIEWWLYIAFGFCILPGAWRSYFFYPLFLIAVGSVAYNSIAGNAPGITAAWLAGAAGYWLLHRHPLSFKLYLSLGLIGFIGFINWEQQITAAYQVLSMLIVSVVILSTLLILRTYQVDTYLLWVRICRLLARYSFSLYLLHFSVLAALYPLYGRMPDEGLIAVAIISCNIVAGLFAYLFEWHWNPQRGFYRT